MKPTPSLWSRFLREPYALSVALLAVGWLLTAILQPAYFTPNNFANNLRSYLPLVLLAVAQTIIVIGGGIDLSLGVIMTLSSVVMVQVFGPNPGTLETLGGIALGLVVGTLAGAVNGLVVAYLRLQPIIATFATSSLWAGVALWVLPQPGGIVPQGLQDLIRLTVIPPFALFVIAAIVLVWLWFLGTRHAPALYAVGGNPNAAFTSGLPVERVRLLSYAVGGLLCGVAALVLISDLATGDPLLGGSLTLSSIVAVVIGGTRLSGGAGSIIGSIIGAVFYYVLRSLVGVFAINLGFSQQWQTLLDGAVIVLALAGPGLARVLRPARARGAA